VHGAAWRRKLFVPKIPSYRITDPAEAIGPDCDHPVIGIRTGEKIHEEMITSSDSFITYDIGKYCVILPQVPVWKLAEYFSHSKAVPVAPGFNCCFGVNDYLLSVDELSSLIAEHINEIGWFNLQLKSRQINESNHIR
jgi:UDP-N-acetylglucosamine 4,6-dehydratase